MNKAICMILLLATLIASSLIGSPSGRANGLFAGADPDIIFDEYRRQYYIYCTNADGDTQEYMKVYASPDLVHWHRDSYLLDTIPIKWLSNDGVKKHYFWAPCVFVQNNKWYLYYSVGPQNPTPSRIGVAVGDIPMATFIDSGKPLVTGRSDFEAIDPMVFRDPKSSKVYLYCGGSAGNTMHAYELNDDLISVKCEVPIETPKNFTEAAFMHYLNGKYYLSYSHGKWNDDSYQVCYSTADSPTGPWTYRGKILESDNHYFGPGHHSFFLNPMNKNWYIVYHRWDRNKNPAKEQASRQVAIDHVYFNKDGSIQPIKMTEDGVGEQRLFDRAKQSEWVGSGEIVQRYINNRGQFVVPDKDKLKTKPAHTPQKEDSFYPCGQAKEDGSNLLLFTETDIQSNHVSPTHYSEGLAHVEIIGDGDLRQCAYIDKTRHVVLTLPAEILDAGDFHEGLAPVSFAHGAGRYRTRYWGPNRISFIDRGGRLAFAPIHAGDNIEWLHYINGIARINIDGYCCYIDKQGRIIGKFFSGLEFKNGVAPVMVVLDKAGKVVAADDISHGYQNSRAFDDAWQKLIENNLGAIDDPKAVEFELSIENLNEVNCRIQKSSGDPTYDAKIQDILTALVPPPRGLPLAGDWHLGPYSFKNGRLAKTDRRWPRTHPTLPEGTPVPDNE